MTHVFARASACSPVKHFLHAQPAVTQPSHHSHQSSIEVAFSNFFDDIFLSLIVSPLTESVIDTSIQTEADSNLLRTVVFD
jgi:hypothetical protein